MQYCEKCYRLTETGVCPSCGRPRHLRQPQADDPVLLCTVRTPYAAMVEPLLEGEKLPYSKRTLGSSALLGCTHVYGKLRLLRAIQRLSRRDGAALRNFCGGRRNVHGAAGSGGEAERSVTYGQGGKTMEAWMTALIGHLQGAFGARLLFVGLQGSRARGEAGQGSDIDAVVILDAVSMEDIRTYRDVLAAMPGREDVCGFFGGREELMRWERGDLFQFVHDTIPFYGALPAITPPLDREDARRAALSGACNIYHGCMHNLLFGRDVSILQGLYKMAAFALRAKAFLGGGGVHLPHGRPPRAPCAATGAFAGWPRRGAGASG